MQMVDTLRDHFYIYEPVELLDQELVVPVFFYQINKKVFAKCLKLEVTEWTDGSLELKIPAEPPFDTTGWNGIAVEEFWRPFEKIRWRNGRLLSVLGGKWLYREHNLSLCNGLRG